MIKFSEEIIFPDYEPESTEPKKKYGNRGIPSAQCPGCGRFAKYLGGRSYYNGNWDCYSFDTECSKCGVQTTECV